MVLLVSLSARWRDGCINSPESSSLSSSGCKEDYPLSPVSTQEFVSDMRSLLAAGAIAQNDQETAETARKVRASFTVLSLALSLGVSGSLISPAEAADSMQLAALPSVAGSAGTFSSFGSDRPDGAAATYHTVADGETIWDIAKSHGVSVEAIKAANGIQEGQAIQVGQVLKVPVQAQPVEPVTASSNLVIEPTAPEAEESVRPESEVAVERLEPEQSSVSLTEFLQEQQVTAPENSEASQGDEIATVASPSLEHRGAIADAETVSREVAQSVRTDGVDAAKREETKADLAALIQLPSTSANTWSAPVPVQEGETVQTIVHEVVSGETLWSIARQYGVDTASLEGLNRIEDPTRLQPGDRVLVPAGRLRSGGRGMAGLPASPNEVEVVPVEATIARLPQRESIQRVQSSVTEMTQSAVITGAPNQADEADASLQGAIEGADAVEPASQPAADPFVVSMLSEVTGDAAVAQPVSDDSEVVVLASKSGEVVIVPSEETSSEAEVTPESATAESEVVNVEFSSEEQVASLEPSRSVAGFSPDELLAVAPLGSEVYSPVVAPVAGQVVSPSMPVLPAQDQFLPEAPARFNGYMWPARGVLTSGYGWRWGRMHRGIDIAGPVGTPIYAAAAGTVVRSGWNSGGYGNLVDIRHEDGSLTRYAHNSRLLVREGERVAQGQQIAEMGSTGYSTGPHLHFEIHPAGQGAVNPMAYLPGR